MAAKYYKYFSLDCKRVINNGINIFQPVFSSYRKFYVRKILYAKEKYTVELLPEVEKLLETGALKHRCHPGIRKTKAFVLPEILKTAVDKILFDESESTLVKEAQDLCNYLRYRRLPVEAYEIGRKISAMVPSFEGNFEDLPNILNKQQIKILKRNINLEMGRWKPLEYSYHEGLVYLVGRLAANYASTSYVFKQLQERIPSFKPTTYFDFGCGVGSALWAAHSFWSDSIKEYFCIDTSADMNDLCQNILTNPITEEKYINPVYFRQFLPASETMKYDLVVSAFSLLDLPTAADRLNVIDTLWRKTKDFLVVIEYGTVAGFHSVMDARDYILKVENNSSPEFSFYSSGAYVVSPCPHDSGCPKLLQKLRQPCGFIVPYQVQFPRKLNQSVAKDWISYVVLKKSPRPEDDVVHPRLVKPVLKKTKHVFCHLCCADGNLIDVVVTKGKHGRNAYRCARTSKQGDILPVNIMPIKISSIEES